MDFSLTGRVAIVTGGGSGIGQGIVMGLAEAGANIVVVGRRPGPLEETCAMVRKLGRKALAVPTDVTDEAQVKQMVQKVQSEFGRIDILVNNAGGSQGAGFVRGRLLDRTLADFDGVFSLNARAVFITSKECARVMLEQKKGVIINIGGNTGRQEAPIRVGLGLYGAAKTALVRLTMAMAAEWGPAIRVVGVVPGNVVTPLSAVGRDPVAAKAAGDKLIMGRVGRPEDFAGISVFLASDAASWITGTMIDVNGGPKHHMPEMA